MLCPIEASVQLRGRKKVLQYVKDRWSLSKQILQVNKVLDEINKILPDGHIRTWTFILYFIVQDLIGAKKAILLAQTLNQIKLIIISASRHFLIRMG